MSKKILSFLKDHHIPVDRNILSYIICVLIAAVLWFLNALNKDYTSEISYPVKYTNFPTGKFQVSPLPKSIVLEVKAKGFALLGYKISTSFQPITVDVNASSNHLLEKNNTLAYTLKLNDIKDKINNQLSSDIKLLNIRPEEIEFTFSYAVSKMLPVIPDVDYTLKKQYILKDHITASPDSVLAGGPALIMDTLNYIRTELWKAGEIGKDASRTLKLVAPEYITLTDKEVRINVESERFTEAKRSIPIQVKNLPDSLNIKLFPGFVELTYEIGLSRYDKVTDTDFGLCVDYNRIDESSFLPVKVCRLPNFIKNLTFSPQKVEYILEKK